ncbi:MAG TPA: STAS domain-containing protein, partial [Pilimelia sp.]|nr:STAS domain-containing protein [Pilimelia sp.]
MDLSLAVTRGADGAVRIRPRGEVDVGNAFRIREVVDALLVDSRPARIVVDLSAVTLIDSLGIGA